MSRRCPSRRGSLPRVLEADDALVIPHPRLNDRSSGSSLRIEPVPVYRPGAPRGGPRSPHCGLPEQVAGLDVDAARNPAADLGALERDEDERFPRLRIRDRAPGVDDEGCLLCVDPKSEGAPLVKRHIAPLRRIDEKLDVSRVVDERRLHIGRLTDLELDVMGGACCRANLGVPASSTTRYLVLP